MKINGVSFNDEWVAKFPSAQAFAEAPANKHLFEMLKTVEARQEQLRAVWDIIVQPVKITTNDSSADASEPSKPRHPARNKSRVKHDQADVRGAEPSADESRAGQSGDGDNLRGEDAVRGESDERQGAEQSY